LLGVVGLALTLTADTTVTSSTPQPLNVQDPGKVTTSGTVEVPSGSTGTLQGGTEVRLTPGFHVYTGATFRAFADFNFGGFANLTDSDADGLPDAWEILHFGNLSTATGIGDNDGDGITNAAEYRAGTNPLVNENTTGLPGSTLVVVRLPNGSYNKVITDWSIQAAP
jgi:hypothetical protein